MKGARKLDAATPGPKVGMVESASFLELSLLGNSGSHREHRPSVAVAFRASHDDFEPLEIEVLHAEAKTSVEPQTRSVEQEPNQATDAFELPEHRGDLGPAEHFREMHGPTGANQVERFQAKLKNFSVQEKKRAQRLVLSRGRNVAFGCEVREKAADIASAELSRMFAAMEENEAPNPGNVGFFGAAAEVARSGSGTDLVKQSRGLGGMCRSSERRILETGVSGRTSESYLT